MRGAALVFGANDSFLLRVTGKIKRQKKSGEPMEKTKTIAAISTGAAPGGIGIVRISGPDARQVADRVFRAKSGRKIADMKGYTAMLGEARGAAGEKLDEVVALLFAAPKSYTGEDVVELSCHGGLYVTNRILREVLDAGASPAAPGEFTRRAFLHGKMDLTQAEAVMQIIGAGGEQAARAAEAGSSGVLSRRIGSIRETLSNLAAHLSAWADFPEEDVPVLEEPELRQGLAQAEQELSALLSTFDRGRVYREGVETVIAGRPNAGKSTLMNLLAGQRKSIVTEFAGTTRDVVEETVLLGGIPLRLADTAGLRDTDDPIETVGVEAARERLKTAQLIFAVFDASQELTAEELNWVKKLDAKRTVAVVNKTDLPTRLDTESIEGRFPYTAYLSAVSGEGLNDLEKKVSDLLGTEAFQPLDGALFTERQRDSVRQAVQAVREAENALDSGFTFDAATVCVEDALSALYALTGERVSEEIIDRVFEQFCVGK